MRYGSQAGVPGAPGNMGAFGGNPQNGRDIVEETRARQFPQFIPPQMGSSNVANAMPGGQRVTGSIGNVAGMTNPTYPGGDPRYGQPMPSVVGPGPTSLNQAEFQGLQQMRNTPGGYENMLQQQGVQMTPYGYRGPTVPGQVPPFDAPVN